jgi:DtxR family Mn-dependent transcriptional regulator
MQSCLREALEDFLEAIWLRREVGKEFHPARYRPSTNGVTVDEVVAVLAGERLVTLEGERARLTEAGELEAGKIVRRHRLAECLFFDLFRTGPEEGLSMACRFEHILNEEATEAVCTLLGHPPACPHGREIPPGGCCRRSAREVKPLVKALSEFAPGARARIVFITPRFHKRMDRLNSFGVLPGAVVDLHQKDPAFVIRVGATEVALEKEIAHEIFAIGLD